ncbi:MAG TPA: TylF/MycF/NovP-related O-methyltransferase, partial [Kineosporiaceae bacterium]|nr:TylF/MycF/NovP-related O-methyltransferase [Kineosporiaceae bacterium]
VRSAKSESAKASQLAARLEAVTKRLEKLAANPVAVPKPAKPRAEFPNDFDAELSEIIRSVRPFTMTSNDKLHALISATRYLVKHQIAGDIVECGVWRGGSMHAVARTLDSAGDHSRELYLLDTFEGMPPPTEKDVRLDGQTAQALLDAGTKEQTIWAYATLEDVQAGFETVPYPSEKVHYVKGKVEETVPEFTPAAIALLRLDTDWYDSTRHELEHLYPRLVSGGVLIIDDYGTWQGSQLATDEFLAKTDARLLMVRAGRGRIAIKP